MASSPSPSSEGSVFFAQLIGQISRDVYIRQRSWYGPRHDSKLLFSKA